MGPSGPHGDALTVAGREVRFVWPSHRVAADIDPLPDDVVNGGDAIGFTIVGLPTEPSETPPADLVELAGKRQ